MKKPWDSFEKNYVAVETLDPESGKPKLQYEYYGPWFICKTGSAAFGKAKWTAGIALVLNIAAILLAGFVDSVLNRAGVTCIPYGLAVAAAIFVLMGAVIFLISGEKVKRPEYEKMNLLLRSAPFFEAVLLLFAFLAGMILLVMKKPAIPEWLPLAGYLLGGCSSLAIALSYRTLRYKEEKNTDFEYAPGFPPKDSEDEE